MPIFQGYQGYEFCAVIKWDPDKIWDESASGVKEVCEELGITLEYSDPQNKDTNGTAEGQIRQFELGIKCGMARTGVDPWDWEFVGTNYKLSTWVLPSTRMVKCSDRDTARPIEMATQGRVSRKMANKMIDM